MTDQIDRKSLQLLSYGLFVVTSRLNGRLNGLMVNTVFQVTSQPPRIAVAVNKENLTHEYITQSGVFAVSVLDEDTPMKFIGLFGYKSGREVDKLSQVTFKEGTTGCPLVTDKALAVMEARVIDRLDVGTHTLFIGDVVSSELLREGTPLTYRYFHEQKKGSAPKAAPTYVPPEEPAATPKEAGGKKMQRYVCDVCGYVYDPAVGDPESGIPAGTPFEELPDDWVCPVCGAGKDEFSPEE